MTTDTNALVKALTSAAGVRSDGDAGLMSQAAAEIERMTANQDALIAAAYEAAAQAMAPMLRSMVSRGEAADTIRALTPADARAKRDALTARAEAAAAALTDERAHSDRLAEQLETWMCSDWWDDDDTEALAAHAARKEARG